MIEINFKQFLMLIRVKHFPIDTAKNKLSDEEEKILNFHISHGFIQANNDIEYLPTSSDVIIGDIPIVKSTTFQITQEGKARISAYKSAFHKWWIPIIISIGSFILSCISLSK